MVTVRGLHSCISAGGEPAGPAGGSTGGSLMRGLAPGLMMDCPSDGMKMQGPSRGLMTEPRGQKSRLVVPFIGRCVGVPELTRGTLLSVQSGFRRTWKLKGPRLIGDCPITGIGFGISRYLMGMLCCQLNSLVVRGPAIVNGEISSTPTANVNQLRLVACPTLSSAITTWALLFPPITDAKTLPEDLS